MWVNWWSKRFGVAKDEMLDENFLEGKQGSSGDKERGKDVFYWGKGLLESMEKKGVMSV